jgi:alkaline phosphatase D
VGPITRREALKLASALGASLAWPSIALRPGSRSIQERRDLFAHGVASGDPRPDSVLLWTRRPPETAVAPIELTVEVALDPDFTRLVSRARTSVSAAADWTCRVLAAGLEPGRVYWYRFVDPQGFASRVGRTITAPKEDDEGAARFTFVSCQNMQMGACNAYRRMIYEDERRPRGEQLQFVLHLGDFVYEVTWYPEDRPQGYYDRTLKDVVRYPNGEKIADFHVPTTVDDYRALYRGYLLDPDLQDARAHWPFVCMWDNHEFSWKGWQSQEVFGTVKPAQTRKAAANQAWFEYQPARVAQKGGSLERFDAPRVADAPITQFDNDGLGQEAGNLAAINSLKINRTFRYGRHLELLLTDNRSFRSQPLTDRPETAPFKLREFPFVVSEDVTEILDAGRSYGGGHPPATISFGDADLPNPRKDAPPLSMLGTPQKAWFLERLRASRATWKVWGNTVAMLDWRIDFQNLPPELGVHWPTTGYALLGDDDWSGYRTERREILDFVRTNGITGFATVAGDRHAFLAGVISTDLPPKPFMPVGAEFVTGSISAPGLAEAARYVTKNNPLRPIYVHEPAGGSPGPAINCTLMNGVRASLALARTNDLRAAVAERNPDNAPQLAFADVGGHGYALVRAGSDRMEVEFVCIPEPLVRSPDVNGGPLAYRVTHQVRHWSPGELPQVRRTAVEGVMPLVL